MGSLNNFRVQLQGGDTSKKLTTGEQAVAGFGAGIVVSFVATPGGTLFVFLLDSC